MAKRVFISFSFVEKGLRNDLLNFFQPDGGPVQATPTFLTQDLAPGGEERIKQAIRQQMQGCAALLVLVGSEAHNSRWIQYEAGVANEFGIPKYRIHHPNRDGGPPNAHRGMDELDWKPAKVAEVINAL